jgi:type IV pilus assembly protein PilV
VNAVPDLRRAHAAGFSLVEVMVATVVLSVGMCGLALLLAQSVRFGHVSSLHAQVSLLAQSAIDRMSSNVQAVWLEAYDGTFAGGASGAAACTTASCTPLQLAQRDLAQLRNDVQQTLPDGSTVSIDCSGGSLLSPQQLLAPPAYDGACVISFAWLEQDEDGIAQTASASWRFRP